MKGMIILMLFVLSGCATLKMPDTTPIDNASYQEVMDISGQSQKQIFERSKQWMALTFVSAKKVIEYENAEEGKIIGNGSSTILFKAEGGISGQIIIPQGVMFSIIEDVKDNKVRVTINNVRITDKTGGVGSGIYADGWKQLQPELIGLCSSLKTFLLSKPNQSSW